MKLIFAVLLGALAASACSSSGVQVTESDPLPLPDRTQIEQSREIRIAPRDKVEVRVFGVEDLSGQFDVDQEGKVKLPLVGAIEAAGQTAIEFSETVETALEASYMQDADVTVLIEPDAVRLITLDGAVNRPGVYEVEGPTSLLKAIALGGGTDRDANTNRVIVFRQIEGERMAAGFNLSAIRDGAAEDPEVFGNDVIVVADSNTRRAYGNIVESIPLIGLYIRSDAGVSNSSR